MRPMARRPRAKIMMMMLVPVLLSACVEMVPTSTERAVVDGDPVRGREALVDYGCGSCHAIPGVPGADAQVGPALDRLAERQVIAGILPNEPRNLIRWIRDPQDVNPGNLMPDLGVSEEDARAIASYLYELSR